MVYKFLSWLTAISGIAVVISTIYKWFSVFWPLMMSLIAVDGFGAFFLCLFKMTVITVTISVIIFIEILGFLFIYALCDSQAIDYDYKKMEK